MLQSHWVGVLCLLPFLVMLGIHDALGLSDAALLLRDQRNRDSQLFNFLMIGAFYSGVVAFIAHAAYLANRGRGWLLLKLALLALTGVPSCGLGPRRGGA